MTIKKRQFATLEMHRKKAFLAYVVLFKLGSPKATQLSSFLKWKITSFVLPRGTCLGKLYGEIGTEEKKFDTWRDSNP